MQTTFECTVCGNEAKWFCGHGCKTPYCGVSCARSVYDTHKNLCSGLVGEGVVDIFDSADRYYNYFNTDNTMARVNHVRDAMAQMESTYDKQRRNMLKKPGLRKKLGYFMESLKRLQNRPGLPNDEKQLYTQYERQAQIWQRDL